MTGLLQTFLTTSDSPNQRGDLDGAAWRFVLPTAADTVEWRLPAGVHERDRAALERHATVVDVNARSEGHDTPARASGATRPRSDVGATRLSVGPASADEPPSMVGIDLLGGGSGTGLELRYEDDELRGIVRASDPDARAVLGRHVGVDGRVPRTWKQRLKRVPVRHRRTAVASLRGVAPGPPAWLVAGAADAGLDVADFGWALWCRGEFGSQKLVMFLIPPGERTPSIVAKITRDPRFNDRLANESDMLARIASLGPQARGGAPALQFRTTVWGSAVSAQSAVEGSDLREHLPDRPELVDRVTAWMSDMANSTRSTADRDELHACLIGVLNRYEELYPVPRSTATFLRTQVDAVAGSGHDAVMQHGDPGPWNALLTPDDTVAFLDWEAGEARGIPLWDLFYFLRSVSLLASPNLPWQTRRSRTYRDLVVGSEIGDWLAGHVRAHVEQTDVRPDVVEPLFHLCWVHRAVKEARRLPVARRSRGTFHNLVLAGVEGRDQPGLRRLTLRRGTEATR